MNCLLPLKGIGYVVLPLDQLKKKAIEAFENIKSRIKQTIQKKKFKKKLLELKRGKIVKK